MRVYCPSRRRDIGASRRVRNSLILRNAQGRGQSAHRQDMAARVGQFTLRSTSPLAMPPNLLSMISSDGAVST